MATNKRKEAAALFELIDKSTLKVPKNAGALKIPSWWSSKSNPPTDSAPPHPAAPASPPATTAAGSQAAMSAPRNGHANGHSLAGGAGPMPQAKAPSTSTPTATPAAPAVPAAAPAAPSPQQRLFEPPSTTGAPAASPSIRPPATHVPPPVSPAVKAPPPPPPAAAPQAVPVADRGAAPAAVAEVAPKATQVITEDELPAEDAVPAARTFAPQTYAQPRPGAAGKAPWSPPRAGAFARIPPWVLGAGVAGLVVVVGSIYLLTRPATEAKAPAKDPAPRILPRPTNSNDPKSILPPSQVASPNAVAPPDMAAQVPDNLPPAAYTGTGGGRVFAPGALASARTPGLLYVLVCSTGEASIAERNAKLLADNGVDVSIETQYPNNKVMYRILSVQGFTSNEAAEPLRRRVVEIGHLLPDYKKTKRAWEDATPMRLSAPRPAAGR